MKAESRTTASKKNIDLKKNINFNILWEILHLSPPSLRKMNPLCYAISYCDEVTAEAASLCFSCALCITSREVSHSEISTVRHSIKTTFTISQFSLSLSLFLAHYSRFHDTVFGQNPIFFRLFSFFTPTGQSRGALSAVWIWSWFLPAGVSTGRCRTSLGAAVPD